MLAVNEINHITALAIELVFAASMYVCTYIYIRKYVLHKYVPKVHTHVWVYVRFGFVEFFYLFWKSIQTLFPLLRRKIIKSFLFLREFS